MSRRIMGSCGLILFLTVLLHAGQGGLTGQSLPPWTPGTLDIHQISTGAGNSSLIVFPDGTTLLVDAGDATMPASVRHPDSTRGAGEWIARYVRQALSHDAGPVIDYALITHFHGDHMGRVPPDAPTGANGYKVSGLSEVAEFIPIRRVLDRGWPDYDYPSPVPFFTEEYRKFLSWQMENGGLRVDRFEAGRSDQIALLRDAARYPNVEVRNVVVNGDAWTGVGTTTRSLFPALQTLSADDYPTENSCSAAIRISYGPFTFYTGGDLTGEPQPGGPPWTNVETEIAPVVGAVDVAVLNHHGMWDASNETFLRTLRPRVIVIPTSNPGHPDHDTALRITSPRLYPGPRDIFATGVLPSTQTVVGASMRQFASLEGHIVVRVEPGGNSYRVFVLDDSTESFTITGVFGPYESE